MNLICSYQDRQAYFVLLFGYTVGSPVLTSGTDTEHTIIFIFTIPHTHAGMQRTLLIYIRKQKAHVHLKKENYTKLVPHFCVSWPDY